MLADLGAAHARLQALDDDFYVRGLLAEGRYRLTIFNRGPWRTVEDVELATLAWVHWWNTARLHSVIGNMPPAEFETAYYAQRQSASEAGVH